MSEFDILSAASAGMDAQRAALDVAARNVAAAQVAGPHDRFSRLVPVYAFADSDAADGTPAAAAGIEAALDANGETSGMDPAAPVRYLGVRSDPTSEVDVVTEMVGVLDAERAFEANASMFDTGKRLAEHTIDMGRL